MCGVRSGVFNRGYNERTGVLPILGEARTEDRVQTLIKVVYEGVEMQACLHVIEGDLASFIIQVDSHFVGLERQQ